MEPVLQYVLLVYPLPRSSPSADLRLMVLLRWLGERRYSERRTSHSRLRGWRVRSSRRHGTDGPDKRKLKGQSSPCAPLEEETQVPEL